MFSILTDPDWRCTVNCVGSRWVAPLLLLLDQYERMSVSSRRKSHMEAVVVRTLHTVSVLYWGSLIRQVQGQIRSEGQLILKLDT